MLSARLLPVAFVVAACSHPPAPAAAHEHHGGGATAPGLGHPEVGFLVAAPDRGFLGDEEIGDAFAGFAAAHNAALVYVTDQRTTDDLHVALSGLMERGARRVVVVPLFLSAGEARFGVLERALAEHAGMVSSIEMGQRLGDSYFAAEMLADRLRTLKEPAGRRVVIAGYGGADAAGTARIAADLERIAGHATTGFGFESVKVVAFLSHDAMTDHRDRAGELAFGAAIAGGPRVAVVPFQLGPKMDSMMTFTGALSRHLHGLAELAAVDLTPDPLLTMWMTREANRHLPLAAEDIGVVFLAHGADHHWNQGMRDAAARLAAKYDVEFAFSMADPPVIERAVRKLEARGKRAIVVLRVFGLASSFRGGVEQMFGLDVEGRGTAGGGGGGHGHGHGHGMAMGPTSRIRTAAVVTTVGGVEDSAHFAAALLDRAMAISQAPERETVVLVAHGDGDDAVNARWRELLGSLATQMKAAGGDRFKAIEVGTWREDWPAQREPEVKSIRAAVSAGAENGGRVIVIPARTTGQGSEKELLDGLTFELGTGFAPHARFDAWLDEQVALGVAQLGSPAPAPTAAPDHHHHH